MKILVKLGGSLLERPEQLRSLAGQMGKLAQRHDLVLVHGGGKQVSSYLQQRGVTSQFVGGLRVSDGLVIDAIAKVIAGSINKGLVAALVAVGCPAVGICGVDGGMTLAVQLRPELQFVGEPVETDGRLLQLLHNAGYVPVVACLAGDRDGNLYNVNADQMAVSCGIGWNAERIIFLTDEPGVKGGNGEVLPRLTPNQVTGLVQSGVAHGGMQAKLEAACLAVSAGKRVSIAFGADPDICLRLVDGEDLGTELVAI